MKFKLLAILLSVASANVTAFGLPTQHFKTIEGVEYNCKGDSNNHVLVMYYENKIRLEEPSVTVVVDGVVQSKSDSLMLRHGNERSIIEGNVKLSKPRPLKKEAFVTIGVRKEICVPISPETNQET